MEVAPWRDASFTGGNQSDGAASPEGGGGRSSFSPNSSLKARSSGGVHGGGESLLGGITSPSPSRPNSNLTNLPLPKFNPGITINPTEVKMSPSGESSPKNPDSPTNLFSRLKLFAKNETGQSSLNKSLQGRHVQFGDTPEFEGGLGEIAERVHSYSPSSSSSRLLTSFTHRSTSSYRPHLSKHHPSLSFGGAGPNASFQSHDDDDASYHPFLVVDTAPGSGPLVGGAPPAPSYVASSPSAAGLSFSLNRRSMGAGLGPSGSSASYEGGLQGQTQAALQQLLKESGGKRTEDGTPRIGRLSLGGALKSVPLSFIASTPSSESKVSRTTVPSSDGKVELLQVGKDRPSPSQGPTHISPGGSMKPTQSGQHVSFRRVSTGSARSSEPRYSAPGALVVEALDEDERF